MSKNTNKNWEKPEIIDLGKAKDIILGFTPADPKALGSGDNDLANGSDV